MKEKLKSLLVPGIYVVAISAFVFSLYFVQKILSNTLLKDKNLIDTDYVDKEIIKNNDYLPVVSDTKTIIKPFTSSEVKVSKEFYVYNGEEDSQKNSIIYYENTYMQNSGIDYYSDNSKCKLLSTLVFKLVLPLLPIICPCTTLSSTLTLTSPKL